MKKAKFIIDNTGNIEMDFLEGFKGESCLEKAKQVELVINGKTTQTKLKDSYYDGDQSNSLIINN